MAFQKSEYPQWSWSSSRKSTFKECKRKYFYNYYLSHNGWEKESPELSRQAYRLKNMTGLHLLLGSSIHKVAEYLVKFINEKKNLPEESFLVDIVRNDLNTAWKESKQKEQWMEYPKSRSMLFEFYYGHDVSKKVIETIKEKMRKSISNILRSKTILDILENDLKIEYVENMDTFELFETPIYAIPDLVYEDTEKKWIVVDWKTGKEHSSHPNQIYVYCMYCNRKNNIPPSELVGRVEYLVTGESKDIEVTEKAFADSEEDIEKSIKEMKSFLKDPEKNIPYEMPYYSLAEHKRLCKWCNFYELCEDELKNEAVF